MYILQKGGFKISNYSIPKYVQIKEYILKKINNGHLKPLEQVPSEMQLRKKFDVSKSTVTRALNDLAYEGYIYREQGKGTFVSPQEKTSLSFWIVNNGELENKFWKKLCHDFNKKNNDLKIDINILPDHFPRAFRDIVDQSLAMGNAPDIISIDGPDVSYYAYKKAIRPLDDFITEKEKQRFIPSIIRQGTYKDKFYQIGYEESTLAILYDRNLFDQLGISTPDNINEAWTWEEFFTICNKIKKETNLLPLEMRQGKGIADINNEWSTYSGLSFIWQNDSKVFSPNNIETTGYLNSQKAVDAMEWLGNIYHKHGFSHIETLNEPFPKGAAMSLSNQDYVLYMKKYYPGYNFGVAPLPQNINQVSPHGGWGLSITNQSENPQEAWKFIKYVYSLENQIKLSKVTAIPVLKEIYYDISNKSDRSMKIIFNQLEQTAGTRPRTPAYPKFSREFAKAYIDIAKGKNVKSTLDRAAYEIDNHIKNHGNFDNL